MTPSVSFITVNRNNAQGLQQTLESLIRLKDKPADLDIELVVIDGDSTDNSIEVINYHRSKLEKVISEPDKGIYDAMQKGIELATKELICFMNAGDSVKQEGMIRLIQSAKSPNEAICGIPTWTGKKKGFPFLQYSPRLLRMPNHQCILIPRKIAQQYGFDSRFRIGADLDQKLTLHRHSTLIRTKIETTLCESGGVSQQIKNWRNLFSRAHEQGSIANKHYGPIFYIINYLFFFTWHSRKLLKKRR